ncbi:alkaline phosphatase family protein [Pyrococcus furiosus DSM 3638]|uniref:Alkaline phosphatase family protein n=3 Tax=Pyrococcus furiosus TaxID=2261 RepID=A0A5C0XPJ2_PYRFU|nr:MULTISPECIES: alkaline phosphatase family protein [Pyrococcus]AAL81172.1 hypothetical protein PF1048 [Pyrococcus furiosus DSM 3638]AFN03844.1 hypothetical protein PFC_04475 [Pyrococcus furiosus COM1]MDK2868827.1 hypothetical protein [Pyrococcus sp.]QEK78709.1 alkaline phosphatase family protein [Pyrococcus furiosus DSM 3638]
MERRKLVLISLDGNGVYNFKYMPFLSELAENGEYFIVDSIFPTLTDLVHTTVMTGVEPRIHWVVENGYYDRITGVKVKFYDFKVAFNPHEVIKAPLIQDILRQRGVRIASVSGYTMPPFSNVDVRIYPPFFSSDELYRKHGRDWKKDLWVLNSAIYLYEECKPDLLLVHFASIDGMQHDYGPESKDALKAIETVDSAVRSLWERLKDEYAFIIFADHGQEEVHTWVNLREYLKRHGIEVLRVSSGGGVHIYLKNPEEKEEAYQLLRRAPGVNEIFFREDLPYLNVPVSGDLIVSAKKGYWFCHHRECQKVKGKSYWVKGMHGSRNSQVMKVPLIIWGLDVKKEEATLYDIAPTILDFFGVGKKGEMKGSSLLKS